MLRSEEDTLTLQSSLMFTRDTVGKQVSSYLLQRVRAVSNGMTVCLISGGHPSILSVVYVTGLVMGLSSLTLRLKPACAASA